MPLEQTPKKTEGAGEKSTVPIVQENMQSTTGSNNTEFAEEQRAPDVCSNLLKDVKVSFFWRTRPKLWFVSLESEFAAFRIRSDETMFRATVRHLDEQTMTVVEDVFERPPESNKYGALKKALIERFSKIRRRNRCGPSSVKSS